MEIQEVTQLIQAAIPDAEIHVQGEDTNFTADVISESFSGVSNLNRQKKVLASVKEQIVTGDIHALSVKTFTPEEWTKKTDLNVL
jgi:acid stress-induced BolA-like protein IbaG/YrbA